LGPRLPERGDRGRDRALPPAPRARVRVLIAGCGYVGTALALRRLAEGHSVVALRRRAEGLPPGAEALAADLSERAALRALPGPFDAAVYAAAPDARDPAAYRRVYCGGVAALLEAVACDRFVLRSTPP